MNALQRDIHKIASISDLDLKLAIAAETITANVNINFTTDIDKNTACMVRIATPDFVEGSLPENSSVYVDVDVFTKPSFKTTNKAEVLHWIEAAHTREKEQFFRLLSDSTIDSLKEK
jgi:uncharacterized protein (TIGR04255 family)